MTGGAHPLDGRCADFAPLLPLRRGGLVWDCMCGAGAVSVALARLGCRVVATDGRAELLRRAEGRIREEGLDGLVTVVRHEVPGTGGVTDGSADAVILPREAWDGGASPDLAPLFAALRRGGALYTSVPRSLRKPVRRELEALGAETVRSYLPLPDGRRFDRLVPFDHAGALALAWKEREGRGLRSRARRLMASLPGGWRALRAIAPDVALVGLR